MAEPLVAAFAAKYPTDQPLWIKPFVKAALRIETVEKREESGTMVTSENKTEPVKKKQTKAKGKAKTKGKGNGKTVIAEEEDDGLGRDVEDVVMMQSAEEYLLQAIELSEGKEALPYAWMTVLHMRKGDLESAREMAMKATAINPLCPTNLFRLSSVFSSERDYANAYLYYGRAVSLLPPSEKVAYTVKLERLRQHAADMTKGYSADPFDVLPLEVIIQILQFALTEDPNVALRASWVNQRWNGTINSCKELWQTLVLTSAVIKKASCEAKQTAWKERAGGNINTIVLKSLTFAAIKKFTRSKARCVIGAKELDVQVSAPNMLNSLVGPLRDYASSVTDFRIVGGYSAHPQQSWTEQSLTCGLIIQGRGHRMSPVLDRLESIEAIDVDYTARYRSDSELKRVNEPKVDSYPALKRLMLKQCRITNVYANTGSGTSGAQTGDKYRADILHTTLAGSPILEYLEVNMNWKDCHVAQSSLDKKFTMPSLKTAKIHPHSIHCIDIDAPNLESIAYVLPSNFTLFRYHNIKSKRQPMIPDVADSLVAADSMAKLTSVEFACHATDDIARLENWISRLPNLYKLVLRNACGTPYPVTTSEDEKPDFRASSRLLMLLNENPELCPSLRHLEMEGCFAPGHVLVEYVKKRKGSGDYATLESVTLQACSEISEKAKTILEMEIGCLRIEAPVEAINGSQRFKEDEEVGFIQAEWMELL